jgi:LCP family protein required for cell wall assembly
LGADARDRFRARPQPVRPMKPAGRPLDIAPPRTAPGGPDIMQKAARPVPDGMLPPAPPVKNVPTTPDRAKTLPELAVAAVVDAPASTAPPAARLAQRTPLDMSLPGEDSPSRLGALFASTRWQRTRRLASRGMAVAMVLVITLGGLLFSQSYLKLHKVFRGSAGTAAALKNNVDPNLLKGEGSGRVNILLLGRGGGTHDAPDLTDTMMVASIDPVNHTSTLISLPRDLWVNVNGAGVMKLNAAWETGEFKYLGKQAAGSTDPKAIQAGFDLADQTVEDVLGIDIHYNMLVNFQAFQQAVDTVGGVNVNVPSDLVDPTMAWENGNNPVLAQAGPRVFNGKQALLYVRSRETTSDFARAQRQQALLVALKSKIITLGTLSNPKKISGLINSFGNNVQTDLSLSNAQRLYTITKGIKDSNVSTVGLADDGNDYVAGGNINGQSVVLPKAGLFQYGQIQQYIRAKLPDPFLIREKAKVLVLNGTLLPNLATNKANELKSYGYNVVAVGNTPNSGYAHTMLVDLSHGKQKYTKHYLEQRLGVSASSILPDNSIQANGANFVIIIGNDEAPTTQSPAN